MKTTITTLKVQRALTALIVLLLLFSGCAKRAEIIDELAYNSGFIELTVKSPSIEQNLLGDPANQKVLVYLPPSYEKESEKRYPVIYFLHGWSGSPEVIMQFKQSFDEVMQNGKGEFIIVAANGKNRYGGGFYVNSPVSGNWEDFTVKEVVSLVDKKFRTIAKREARGIAGFSMGGFGAYNLGFKHPEVYSALYSLAPGAFAEDGLDKAMTQWNETFLNAYSAAFSPNPKKGSLPYADIPSFNQSTEDLKLVAKWEEGYGNLESKVEEYSRKKQKLQAIKLEYGTNDYYRWIPEGTIHLSNTLNTHNIAHEIVSFTGGHSLSGETIRDSMLPFFQAHLKFE